MQEREEGREKEESNGERQEGNEVEKKKVEERRGELESEEGFKSWVCG